jgi:cytochrome c-type biogenesis protein CcmE
MPLLRCNIKPPKAAQNGHTGHYRMTALPAKNSKSMYITALILLLGGIGYLIATGLATGSVLHIQVAEALVLPADQPQNVSITGAIKAEGISALHDSEIRFQLQDHKFPDKSLWVSYRGHVPDLFAPGAPIIIEGRFHGQGQDFKALRLTTICPAKYEEKVK